MANNSTVKKYPVDERRLSNSTSTSMTSTRRRYECITLKQDDNFAWIITLAAFLINAVIDGFIYGFGAISEDLKTNFRCKEWEVSTVISLAVGFYLLSAPIAASFCKQYGCGMVGIFGSVLAFLSILISIKSLNIYMMWILFGILGGTGLGCVFLPSIVIIGTFFDKKRGIMTGIVTAGTGIGTVSFGPLSNYLFKLFGWETGLAVLTSSLLICALFSLIMLPFRVDLPEDSYSNQTNSDTNINNRTQVDETKKILDVDENTDRRDEIDSEISSQKNKYTIQIQVSNAGVACEKLLENEGKLQEKGFASMKTDGDIYQKKLNPISKILSNLFPLHQYRSRIEIRNMALICLGNITPMFGYYVPYLFITKVANSQMGIDPNTAAFLISIIGFSNTLGRLLSGIISKIKGLNPLRLHNIGFFVAGVVLILLPFSTRFVHLSVLCGIWGFFIAFYVALQSVIICDVFGVEKFSSTFSITLMFRGITSLIAPPIMGGIRDLTSSFTITFIFGGIALLLSGLVCCFIQAPKKASISEKFGASKGVHKHQQHDIIQPETKYTRVEYSFPHWMKPKIK